MGQVPLNIVAFFCRQPSPYPCRRDALSPWRTKGNSPPLPLPVTSAERKMGFYVAQSLQTAGTDCKIGMTNKMEFRWISILRTHYDMSRLWDLKPSQNSGQSFLNHANNMAGLGLGLPRCPHAKPLETSKRHIFLTPPPSARSALLLGRSTGLSPCLCR